MKMLSPTAVVSPIETAAPSRKRNRVSDNLGITFLNENTKNKKPKTEQVRNDDVIDSTLIPRDDVIDRIRDEYTRNLVVKRKKLHLVLDLDHTLLNSARISDLSPEEERHCCFTSDIDNSEEVHVIEGVLLVTKLRPYARKFLERASRMFELSICTMGSGDYASLMAALLDPTGCIFENRIVSRDDLRPRLLLENKTVNNNQKGLDLSPVKPSIVVILDDTLDVWRDEDRANVIQIPRYHFFKSSCDKFGVSSDKAYSEMKSEECNKFGVAYLEVVLNVLKKIHKSFFDDVELGGCEVIDRDVRDAIRMVKEASVKKCKKN